MTRRIVAEDLSHSGIEQGFFCLGWVDGGVMTVRFTSRKGGIRIFGAGYWRKGKKSMSSGAVKHTDGEIGRYRVVEDFLPSPDALVPREDTVKVTLGLSRRSVEFFKRAAKQRRLPISA